MRIPGAKLDRYLKRLSNSAKHQDVLSEISPILGVDAGVSCEFEVSGYGVGKRTIDWLLRPSALPAVLLDVKCRIRDLIEGLAQIASGHLGPDGQGPSPLHNIAIMFKDTEEKFIQKSPNEMLQGVWIISHLRQERSELNNAFNSLDSMKLHFAVIANWQKDVYVLVRDGIPLESITSLFNVTHSNRFVFDRSQNSRREIDEGQVPD